METMKFKHVHVVAFDLPFPPNYGGSTDMYFKLVHLQKLGISVTLHVFLYDGKEKAPDLEKVTFKTIYYSRKRYKNPFFGKLPYIEKTKIYFKICWLIIRQFYLRDFILRII